MLHVTRDDIVTALNVNGIDMYSPQFFDEDEWDEYVEAGLSIIDDDAVESATLLGENILEKNDLAIEEIERQLRDADII